MNDWSRLKVVLWNTASRPFLYGVGLCDLLYTRGDDIKVRFWQVGLCDRNIK